MREELGAAVAELRMGPKELVELYNDFAVPYQVSGVLQGTAEHCRFAAWWTRHFPCWSLDCKS